MLHTAQLTIEHAIDRSFRQERENCGKAGACETAAVDFVLAVLDCHPHRQKIIEHNFIFLGLLSNHVD